MRSLVGYLIVALLLVAGGFVLWSAALHQQRLVGAERDLASLQFERASVALDALAQSSLVGLVPGFDAASGAAHVSTMRDYWQSRYDRVSGDPAFALLAANAAYRAVEREGGPWATVVGRLDAVVKRYGEVLRSEPGNEDAAYNYEFAVRRRAAIAATRQPVPAHKGTAARTLHGQAGAPPSAADMKQFKMIVPMLPQEREEAEQAGRGSRPVRKG